MNSRHILEGKLVQRRKLSILKELEKNRQLIHALEQKFDHLDSTGEPTSSITARLNNLQKIQADLTAELEFLNQL